MAYSLKRNFKGSFIFTHLLTKASGFFLIPLYTRFLTLKDYGVISYVLAIAQILSTCLLFGFFGSQERFYYEYKR